MVSMMKNEPTFQELVNLVEFLSHRIDMLDKTQDLMIKSNMMLSNREKEVKLSLILIILLPNQI